MKLQNQILNPKLEKIDIIKRFKNHVNLRDFSMDEKTKKEKIFEKITY